MVVNKANTSDVVPEGGLNIELDIGKKPSGIYKGVAGVTHTEVITIVDMSTMTPTEKDFILICKLYLLKAEKDLYKQILYKRKFGENIRDDLERGTTPQKGGVKELIQKYQGSWNKLKPHWGSHDMFSEILEQLTSDPSPDRPGVREGFNSEYHQLLQLIQELHMELYPNPRDLHPHKNRFLPPVPVPSKKPSY